MRTSLLASTITLILAVALIAIKAIVESKSFTFVLEGAVLIGGVLALGAFFISLAGIYITKHKKRLWPTFLILSLVFGLSLGIWNIFTLSNDMSITTNVVAKQLFSFIVTGFTVGGIAYVCHKVRS